MYSKMYYLISLLIGFNTEVNAIYIEKQINDYFNSEIYHSFQNKWQSYKTSQENAVLTMLKENYGYKPMNVYVRQLKDSYLLTKGFYITDNIVDLLMLDLKLSEIPRMQAPEVKLGLASNYLHLNSGLRPIVVQTYYLLFRNDSSIVYGRENRDPYKHSPFTFPQVHEFGEIAIRAEGCTLSGTAILTLDGTSVNLAHNTFKVKNCTFTVEISTPGTGLPPVIAPYFSEEQGESLPVNLLAFIEIKIKLQQFTSSSSPFKFCLGSIKICNKIENLISKPLRDELIPKLQGTLFSFLNTSAIFGADLKKYRKNQRMLVKVAAQYMTEVAGQLNKATIQNNQGYVDLPDSGIRLKSVFNDRPTETFFLLANVSMYGLDTVYSAQSGGPYKTNNGVKVAEAIRYHSLQIRGKIYFENKTTQGQQEFAVELLDVNFDVIINLNDDKNKFIYDFVGWREMEFSLGEFNLFAKERIASHALITGYLINEVPKTLISNLEKLFPIVAEMSHTNTEQNSRSEIGSGTNKNKLTEDDNSTDETHQKQHDKGLDSEKVINNRTGFTENSDHKTEHEKEITEPFFSQSDEEKKRIFSEEVLTENKSPLFSDSGKGSLTEDQDDVLASDKEQSSLSSNPNESLKSDADDNTESEEITENENKSSESEETGDVESSDEKQITGTDTQGGSEENSEKRVEHTKDSSGDKMETNSAFEVKKNSHEDAVVSAESNEHTDDGSNRDSIASAGNLDQTDSDSILGIQSDEGTISQGVLTSGILTSGVLTSDVLTSGVLTSDVLTSDNELLRSARVNKGTIGDKPIVKDNNEKKKRLLRNKTYKQGQKNLVHDSEQYRVKHKIRSSNTNKRKGQVFHRNSPLIHMSENEIK